MPTYSYKCTKCNKVFDAFHSMSCSDAQHCPECNSVGNKLMSAGAVIFKGSGFYSTDYRDSGYLEAQKSETKDSKADTKETKSENNTQKSSDAPKEKAAKPTNEKPAAKAA